MSAERPYVVELDCSTGDAIARPMDDAELAQWETDAAAAAARAAEPPPATLAEQIAAAVVAALRVVQPLTPSQLVAVGEATAAALDPAPAADAASGDTLGGVVNQ